MTTTAPMEYQDKFNALARAVELQPQEQAAAKFFWYAGLRHAFQRGTSKAALLSSPNTSLVERSKLNWPLGIKQGSYERSCSILEASGGNPNAITPYEAKLMQLLLAEVLSRANEEFPLLQQEINSMWKHCDPADDSTEGIFSFMNKCKTRLYRLKKQYNTFASLQRKLKKISKGP